mmetsp:Transcript_45102/g.107222  ORF Transcript_45102/g.107222 Transcript_45102/m.107222 type:complete len:252 (-) Transcript_45102:801-1556(-)
MHSLVYSVMRNRCDIAHLCSAHSPRALSYLAHELTSRPFCSTPVHEHSDISNRPFGKQSLKVARWIFLGIAFFMVRDISGRRCRGGRTATCCPSFCVSRRLQCCHSIDSSPALRWGLLCLDGVAVDVALGTVFPRSCCLSAFQGSSPLAQLLGKLQRRRQALLYDVFLRCCCDNGKLNLIAVAGTSDEVMHLRQEAFARHQYLCQGFPVLHRLAHECWTQACSHQVRGRQRPCQVDARDSILANVSLICRR